MLNREQALIAASELKLLVSDIDGILTDGSLWFGNQGDELKAFNIQDGLGIKLLRDAGIDTCLITGRRSELVLRRAKELGITRIVQGREDKATALRELCAELDMEPAQVAYIGDDLPDLGAIRLAGLGVTVADGHRFVAQHCDWQTQAGGGRGAIRELCEFILEAKGLLEASWSRYL